MTSRDLRLLRTLRRLSLVEGVSTLVLFGVAMPLKYAWGLPQAVTVVGGLHGALFVGLCLLAVWAVPRVPLPAGLWWRLCAAAVVPFGPFLMDGRLRELEG
jgi:integral membrane protein